MTYREMIAWTAGFTSVNGTAATPLVLLMSHMFDKPAENVWTDLEEYRHKSDHDRLRAVDGLLAGAAEITRQNADVPAPLTPTLGAK